MEGQGERDDVFTEYKFVVFRCQFVTYSLYCYLVNQDRVTGIYPKDEVIYVCVREYLSLDAQDSQTTITHEVIQYNFSWQVRKIEYLIIDSSRMTWPAFISPAAVLIMHARMTPPPERCRYQHRVLSDVVYDSLRSKKLRQLLDSSIWMKPTCSSWARRPIYIF